MFESRESLEYFDGSGLFPGRFSRSLFRRFRGRKNELPEPVGEQDENGAGNVNSLNERYPARCIALRIVNPE